MFGFMELHQPSVWSNTNKDTSIAVTGLTISGGGGSGGSTFVSARSGARLAVGQKIYFEVTIVATAGNSVIGFTNNNASLTSYPGSDMNGMGVAISSNEYYNGRVVGSSGVTLVSGSTVGIALDGVNKLLWARVSNNTMTTTSLTTNGQNWGGFGVGSFGSQWNSAGGSVTSTNSGVWNPLLSTYGQNWIGYGLGALSSQWDVLGSGNDPASAVGGASGVLAFALPIYITFSSSSATTETIILNSGATPFVFTPPSGFRAPNACSTA